MGGALGSPNRILNLAFYKFVPIADPIKLKEEIQEMLGSLSIKGTLILAHEGMNGFLSGPTEATQKAFGFLKSLDFFHDLVAKESESDFIPYSRFNVKVKKEIVTFRVDELTPPKALGKRISPEELSSWYKNGEDFVILDTRNEFEFQLGAFDGAQSLNITHFVDFADAVKPNLEKWKDKKIVTFCTGGIRCEKAAPYIASLGHSEVYQLDGGILKYFETVGGSHWHGECFVFDHRVAVNPELKPTGARLCKGCHMPVQKDIICSQCGK